MRRFFSRNSKLLSQIQFEFEQLFSASYRFGSDQVSHDLRLTDLNLNNNGMQIGLDRGI